jgi:hypothetical protein
MSDALPRPLDGITVVDLTIALAGRTRRSSSPRSARP